MEQPHPAPAEPQPEAPPIVLPLPNMDEDENEMEDVIVPNEDVDTMMVLGKNKRSGNRHARMKSNLLKKETYGLWWIVCQIKNPSNAIGYSQRNRMEDLKPAWLQKAFHKSMVKTMIKPSHQSHTLKQYDCFWLMHVETTGK